jgi:hypothetical protein
MSLIESLLESTKTVTVPCQTDEEYKITSNQCSWCAAIFGIRYKELLHLFLHDKDKFVQLYQECLMEGTKLRKEHKKPTYGENIDNTLLKKTLDLEKRIIVNFTFEENKQERDELLSILPEDLKNEFYSNKYFELSNLSSLSTYKFILVSRHGQSFTLIPFYNYFLVLDSHVHTVGLMTKENTYKYIKYSLDDNITGYLFTTILCCC